ncbi:hypothetical protein GOP47_0006010 [Adiantum capillus-veneris]|uniref:Uncharacterized protein n=1 Tax=Adiantum capillus-veneris TaxID=13818 RepID=A0A9D4ZK01_ADICA|nr:hypothetical protein GOP47_0006010 [Adiantum capillus-veneris]
MSAILESVLYSSVSPEGKGKRAKKRTTEEVYQRDKKLTCVEQLISIMKQLELCFEVNKDDRIGLFIPATLRRRLMCKDEEHTFFTPGLFPRLQVHLRNVFKPTCYQLERDLIKIVDAGMEVIIEFNDMPLSFIDIMVKFPSESKDEEDVFTFINNVISGVRDLQRDSGCWGGVELVEAALRASCLEKLTLPQLKGKEFATIEHLRGKIRNSDVLSEIERTTHTWGALKASNLNEECVEVVSLLGKKYYLSIMEERFTQLEELSKCLGVEGHRASYASSSQSPATGDSQTISETRVGNFQLRRANSFLGKRDANMYRIGSQVEMLGSKMEMLTTKVTSLEAEVHDMARDIKRGVENLNEQKKRLLPEVRRILGELRNASSTEATSDIPKFFIFEDEISRHLVCKLVPGVRKYRLRFMCESEPMPHVPEQAGMGMKVGEGAVRSIMPYLQNVLRVLAVGLRLNHSRDQMVRDVDPRPGDMGPVASVATARIWVKGLMQQEGCYHDKYKMYNMSGLMKDQFPDGRWVWLCDRHHP